MPPFSKPILYRLHKSILQSRRFRKAFASQPIVLQVQPLSLDQILLRAVGCNKEHVQSLLLPQPPISLDAFAFVNRPIVLNDHRWPACRQKMPPSFPGFLLHQLQVLFARKILVQQGVLEVFVRLPNAQDALTLCGPFGLLDPLLSADFHPGIVDGTLPVFAGLIQVLQPNETLFRSHFQPIELFLLLPLDFRICSSRNFACAFPDIAIFFSALRSGTADNNTPRSL